MLKIAWFFILFAAGFGLLVTLPESAANPEPAVEREGRPGELSCPFDLGHDGSRTASRVP